MIRCGWKAGTDHECEDPADLIVNGSALCEAHHLHQRHLDTEAFLLWWAAKTAELQRMERYYTQRLDRITTKPPAKPPGILARIFGR